MATENQQVPWFSVLPYETRKQLDNEYARKNLGLLGLPFPALQEKWAGSLGFPAPLRNNETAR